MTIGVVTTSYPRWPDDPAGNFVGAHVAALRALGHEVEVVAAGPADTDEPGVTRIPSGDLFYTGGAPDRLEQRGWRAALTAAAFSARLATTVATRAYRWSSIIAHWLAPSALAAIPARLPLLAIAHGGDVHTLRRARLLSPALHALHARRAQLVFVSDELRAIAMASAPRLRRWLATARIQPMGIDVERFAAITRAPTDPPTVLVVARLVPIKGIDVAIAAVRLVKHPVRLVIAGDGPERDELERLASGARIHFTGAVDTRARDRWLGTASAVLVPSRMLPSGRTEGTPLIALEALAAGVPVIASALGGLRSLDGVMRVRSGNVQALAAAVDHVLDAPPDAGELQARVAHLDWRRVARELMRSE